MAEPSAEEQLNSIEIAISLGQNLDNNAARVLLIALGAAECERDEARGALRDRSIDHHYICHEGPILWATCPKTPCISDRAALEGGPGA